MKKLLVAGALLLLSVACGGAAEPAVPPTGATFPAATRAPTVAAVPTVIPTVIPTASPPPTPTAVPAPTATPLPAPTSTPEPTAAPTNMPALESPSEEGNRDTSALDSVFPEIREKLKDIRPVYTAYFHSEDWQSPGKNTTVDEVFKLLKMDNIVTHEGRQEVSPAMVVEQEPDLIIAGSIESVVENPALSGLHMVSDTAHIPHHVFVMKEGYSFYVADPGFRDTVAAFAAFAYPDTFPMEEAGEDDHGEGHEEGEKAEEGRDHAEGGEMEGQEEGGHGHGDGHSHSH